MVGVIGELEGFFVGFPFCIPLVYSSGASLLFFWSIYCFLPIKKKKKNLLSGYPTLVFVHKMYKPALCS